MCHAALVGRGLLPFPVVLLQAAQEIVASSPRGRCEHRTHHLQMSRLRLTALQQQEDNASCSERLEMDTASSSHGQEVHAVQIWYQALGW